VLLSLSLASCNIEMRPNYLCCRDSGWLLPMCTDSSADTVANRPSTWLRLIALLGLVKPSTFTEHEHVQCGRTFRGSEILFKQYVMLLGWQFFVSLFPVLFQDNAKEYSQTCKWVGFANTIPVILAAWEHAC
jgi:hypothetical protein